VNTLYRNAQNLLETALAVGANAENWAVVLDRQGGIRLLNPEGWNLSALAAEFGAETVFSVCRKDGAIRVNGLRGNRSCVLHSEMTGRNRVDAPENILPIAQATISSKRVNDYRLKPVELSSD